MKRALLLVEVLIGLALLALLGAWLLRLQSAAVRQLHHAELLEEAVQKSQALLWEWSSTGVRVTLPASGRFDERLSWQRKVQPIRVAEGLLPDQVTLVVRHEPVGQAAREVLRLDWLVPGKE